MLHVRKFKLKYGYSCIFLVANNHKARLSVLKQRIFVFLEITTFNVQND